MMPEIELKNKEIFIEYTIQDIRTNKTTKENFSLAEIEKTGINFLIKSNNFEILKRTVFYKDC